MAENVRESASCGKSRCNFSYPALGMMEDIENGWRAAGRNRCSSLHPDADDQPGIQNGFIGARYRQRNALFGENLA